MEGPTFATTATCEVFEPECDQVIGRNCRPSDHHTLLLNRLNSNTSNNNMPSTPTPNPRMKRVHRQSTSDDYELLSDQPIPSVPEGGARIKVHYAGACYTEKQLKKSGMRRPKWAGVKDTTLFPGYEVSGEIDELCPTLEDSEYSVGDHVIIYPDEAETEIDQGYEEYIIVKDVSNLVKIPPKLDMKVASILPTGALMAMCAVNKIKPYVQHKVQQLKGERQVDILLVSAGALGLWTICIAKHLLREYAEHIHVSVADNNIDHLMVAKDHGANDIIHWSDQVYEEHLIARTNSVCESGVDIAIDFSSCPRTVNRAKSVLGHDGILVVGGIMKYEIQFSLSELAQKNQCIMGVRIGSREQLKELVQMVADHQIQPPTYHVFPVEEANKVFRQLSQCEITGRAVLEVSPLGSP